MPFLSVRSIDLSYMNHQQQLQVHALMNNLSGKDSVEVLYLQLPLGGRARSFVSLQIRATHPS